MYSSSMFGTFVSGLALMSSAVAAETHRVEVGSGGQLVFNPASTNALAGDIVEFVFFAKNHSVVQSTFANPCQSTTGFFSGFMPVADGQGKSTFQVTVNDTKPIWFYCSQAGAGGHCAKGMVGCVNCPKTGNTLDAFTAAAKNTTAAQVKQPAAVAGGILAQNSGASASTSGSGLSTSTRPTSTAPTSTPGSSTGAAATPTRPNAAPGIVASKWTVITAMSGIAAFSILFL